MSDRHIIEYLWGYYLGEVEEVGLFRCAFVPTLQQNLDKAGVAVRVRPSRRTSGRASGTQRLG